MPFQKGNTYSKGRPKISLNKPELLLPIIFQKAHINWAHDFTRLYKKRKEEGPLTGADKQQWNELMDLMPYLCTKVQIKDLDAQRFVTPEDSKAMAQHTKTLLDALEKETNAPNAKPASPSPQNSVADRVPQVPPTA